MSSYKNDDTMPVSADGEIDLDSVESALGQEISKIMDDVSADVNRKENKENNMNRSEDKTNMEKDDITGDLRFVDEEDEGLVFLDGYVEENDHTEMKTTESEVGPADDNGATRVFDYRSSSGSSTEKVPAFRSGETSESRHRSLKSHKEENHREAIHQEEIHKEENHEEENHKEENHEEAFSKMEKTDRPAGKKLHIRNREAEPGTENEYFDETTEVPVDEILSVRKARKVTESQRGGPSAVIDDRDDWLDDEDDYEEDGECDVSQALKDGDLRKSMTADRTIISGVSSDRRDGSGDSSGGKDSERNVTDAENDQGQKSQDVIRHKENNETMILDYSAEGGDGEITFLNSSENGEYIEERTQIPLAKDVKKNGSEDYYDEDLENNPFGDEDKAERQRMKEEKKAEKQRLKEEKRAEKQRAKDEAREARGGKPSPVPFIIIGSILLLICLVYGAGAVYFSSHFGPHTVINGVDCSYKNVQYVEDVIKGQVENYELTIKERNNASEKISGASVDLNYVPDGQVKQLIKDQKPMLWFLRFLNMDKLEEVGTHASVVMDEKKFDEIVSKLNCMDEAQMIAPADAYPELQGSLFVAHPEEKGTTLADKESCKKLIKESMLETLDAVDLDKEGMYTNPTYTTESPEITGMVDRYNQYASLSITYHFGDQVEVLDGATTSSWFTWDENLNPVINQDAIVAWARDFGIRHDTIGRTRTITNPYGETFAVTGGTYGWSVDEAAEIDMINQMFTDMTSQDREPIWAQTAVAFGEQDFGNTYIEVNLSTQHMIFWQEGASIFENDVVTGLPNGTRNTPEGTWSILEMKQNKTLRGDRRSDGSYEYETPVAYWMRVTWSGVGFHDATWQSSFGGNRYTYAGSHGCINMSYSGAQTLYGICYVGCPVIIHY